MRTTFIMIIMLLSISAFAQDNQRQKTVEGVTEDDFCVAVSNILADRDNGYKLVVGQEFAGDTWDPQEVLPGAMRLHNYKKGDKTLKFLMDSQDDLKDVKDEYNRKLAWLKVCLDEAGYTFIENYEPADREMLVFAALPEGEEMPALKLKILDNRAIIDNMAGVDEPFYTILEFR